MAYKTNDVVTFQIRVPEMVDGHWRHVYRTGRAKVLDYGFQMQLGDTGYDLEVISEDKGAYAPGTTVRAFSHSVSK